MARTVINMGQYLNLLERANLKLPTMSESMAKIAKSLVSRPEIFAEFSIVELAKHIGTSTASITRFCRLLGYTNYMALRLGAADLNRQDISQSTDNWVKNVAQNFGPNQRAEDVLASLLRSHVMSLQTTAKQIDFEALQNVAERIFQARKVDIYGVAGSGQIGTDLQLRLYRIGIEVRIWTELHTGLISAATLDSDCLAFAISVSGETDQTIEMVEQAKQRGATIVALTHSIDSKLSKLADYSLLTSPANSYLQPIELAARGAQFLVVDMLYLLVAQKNFPRTVQLLQATSDAVAPHRKSRKNLTSKTKWQS